MGYERVDHARRRAGALARCRSSAGVALVEDGAHRLARIEAVPAAEIDAREPELLAQARAWMPALPFTEIDVLIVDEIGKNISGAGMDTNVIGRGVDGEPLRRRRRPCARIYVREPDARVARQRGRHRPGGRRLDAARRRPWTAHITYTNALSALTPATVRIPLQFATDAECLAAAARAGRASSRRGAHRAHPQHAGPRPASWPPRPTRAELAGRADLTCSCPPAAVDRSTPRGTSTRGRPALGTGAR